MKKLVADLNDRRPVWAIPPGSVERIRGALPDGWTAEVVGAVTDGSGDGRGGPSEEALREVRDAEIYLGYGVPPEILRAGPGLRWVHSAAAGVGGSLTAEMRGAPVAFTNSAGIHGPPVAETVVAMCLHFARGLDVAVRAQREGEWRQEPFFRDDPPVRELAGSTVGVVGYGGIGREVGRRMTALGARVLGLRRSAAGDAPPGVELLRGPEGLRRLLDEADFVVVSAPETTETRGMIDAEALARMGEGAVLVNVSRGKLVDEEALVAALRAGSIRGAALDVFATEPLPGGHPLWGLPNALLTPHVSAVSRRFWERETDLVVENLRRYLRGEPLLNRVDPDAGY